MRGDQEYSSNSVWILRNISQIQDISNIRTVELSSQRSSFDVLISMFFFKDGIPPRPEGWPGRLLPHEPKKGHFPPEATALPEHAGLKTCCPKLPAQIRLLPSSFWGEERHTWLLGSLEEALGPFKICDLVNYSPGNTISFRKPQLIAKLEGKHLYLGSRLFVPEIFSIRKGIPCPDNLQFAGNPAGIGSRGNL